MFTETLKERDALAAAPASKVAGTGAVNTGLVDMSLYHRVEFLVSLLSLAGDAQLDAKLQQGNESDGSDMADITGAAITQYDPAGTATIVNKNFTIEIRADQLTKRYVRGVLTITTSNSTAAMIPLGTEARHKPVSDNASAIQRVVV